MKINGKHYLTIWHDVHENNVHIIDQTKLPFKFEIKKLETFQDGYNAIKDMLVRGAPLIGATAAYSLYLASKKNEDFDFIKNKANEIKTARPTAVNLSWAADRVLEKLDKNNLKSSILNECKKICLDDIKISERIGDEGLKIIKKIKKNKINILTHCNAGWLATIDWGTATAPIYKARDANINVHTWVDETRPRNQGSSLTSYELLNENIDHKVIADNTGGLLMQKGMVDMCIVGTDRVSRNGDVANKIGTYLKALAAKDNNVPFYVALPSTTYDKNILKGEDIPIEERSDDELKFVTGYDEDGKIKKIKIYPDKSEGLNLAFDITPAELITGFITENGIFKPEELVEVFK
tara:strand:+ start:72 stop:1124 length:1053 start_codon:yes stop_codon:yes gene_type:complete